MSFWTYMIQCGDRTLYVGHTNDLEQRWREHQARTLEGYTHTRHPLHLVWSEKFPSRYEAVVAEKRLKGWGRDKKLALIRGDLAAMSVLARSSNGEGRASKSSAQTEWGQALGPLYLHPHSATLPSEPFSLEVEARPAPSRLKVRYRLTGDIALIRVPSLAAAARSDELWKTTCFEAFLRDDKGGGYAEFNMSPSTNWAAYSFESYRAGMNSPAVLPPTVRVTKAAHKLELMADLTLPEDFSPTRLGLSAVIEEMSGHKSYWALAHPPGEAPDFHHPDCFAFELPSASAT